MKRMTAMLLAICMILCQLPLPALAAVGAYAPPEPESDNPWFGTWDKGTADADSWSLGRLEPDGEFTGYLPNSTINSDSGTVGLSDGELTVLTISGVDALANPVGDGWSFDASTATLTLAGAVIDAGGADFAIYAEGDLNIQLAEGTENAISGFNVTGIHVLGRLCIQGAHLYIASDAENTLAIGAETGVEILNCANLETATTGAGISTNQTITIDNSTAVIRNSSAGICAPGQITVTNSHVTTTTDITLEEIMANGTTFPPAGIYSETAVTISQSEVNVKSPMFAIIADVNETQMVIEDSTIRAEAGYGGIAAILSTSITGSDVTIAITTPMEDLMQMEMGAPPNGLFVLMDAGTMTIQDSVVTVDSGPYAIAAPALQIETSDIDITNCLYGITGANTLYLDNCEHIRVVAGTEMGDLILSTSENFTSPPPAAIISFNQDITITNCPDILADGYVAGILANNTALNISNSAITAYGGGYGLAGIPLSIDNCDISAHGTWSEEQVNATGGYGHPYAIAGITGINITNCIIPDGVSIGFEEVSGIYVMQDAQGAVLADVELTAEQGSDEPASKYLEILSVPTNCCVGEELNLDELIVAVVFPDGTRQLISSSLLTLSGFDSATPGMKEVTGTYNGMSVTFTVPVHEGHTTEEIPSVFYPESDHNYLDNLDDTQNLTWPGAFSLTLNFSQMTELEGGFDRLYVCDGNDNEIAIFTGTEAAGVSLEIPGDTVKLRLVTDGSVNFYGYSFDSITAETLLHTGQVLSEATDSTCSVPGTTQVILCDICGNQIGGHELPLADHEYESVVTEPTPEAYGYTTHTCIHCGDSYTDSITVYGAIDCGTCGENVTWALTEDYELVISGQGEMYDYGWSGSPWNSYCEQITAIVVNEGITRIGEHTFEYCYAVSSISLPGTLVTISDFAFQFCTSVTSVVIPDSVTYIGRYCFDGCSALESISLPSNLECISQAMLSGCESLTEVDIPDSVTTIEGIAFSGCRGLTTIDIPDAVYRIGGEAFSNCDGLTSVLIPARVDDIWENPFAFCDGLEEIQVAEDNPYYCAVDGILYSYDKTSLISYPGARTGSFIIPEHVTSVREKSFAGCRLSEVVLPEGITAIERDTFYECQFLESVIIPDSVTVIGQSAFAFCYGLESIDLPEELTELQFSAFYGCNALSQIVLPEKLTVIGNQVFWACTCLSEITIPGSVTSIGEYAFRDCLILSHIEFLGDAPEISGDTFEGVTATVIIPSGNPTWTEEKMQSYGGNLNWIVRGEVTGLELEALPGSTFCLVGETPDLTGIQVRVTYDTGSSEILPVEMLTVEADTSEPGFRTATVRYGDFSASFDITVHAGSRMELDPSEYPESEHNYTNYMDQWQSVTMEGCDTIVLTFSSQTYTEPCDYIHIHDGDYNLIATFSGSDAAGVTVEVPGDTVHIRMTSDGSVTYYGYSFDRITGLVLEHELETLEGIEPTCTEPGRTEGTWCVLCQKPAGENPSQILPATGHSYEETRTPSSSEGMGYITYTCHCGDTYQEPWDFVGEGICGEHLSWAVEERGLFFMGSGMMDDYTDPAMDVSGAAPWYQHRNLFTYIDWNGAVQNIGSYAFAGSELTSVTIPSTVTSIGKGAFSNSASLINATITAGVMFIGDDAFSGCGALSTVTIPSTVVEIGQNAFSGCANVTIRGVPGSPAEAHANAHGIPFEAIGAIASGSYGENIIWEITGDNVLYVSGEGEILRYTNGYEDYPWHGYAAQIRAIVVKEGIVSIPEGCFSVYSNAVEYISIPASVKKMDVYSWPWSNGNVRTLNVADLESWLRVEFGNTRSSGINSADQLLENGVPVRDLVIPEGVTTLPRFLFADYRGSFDSVTIPSSLKSVGRDAFEIDGSIGTVYTSSLEDWCQIDFNTPTSNPLFFADSFVVDGQEITELVIPGTVTELGDGIFSGYDRLERVVIPDSVTGIAYSAFANCTNLKDVTLPETLKSIGDYAFSDNHALTSLQLPAELETIGSNSFYRCGLEQLDLPAALNAIGAYAFFDCDMLNSMTIPAGITEVLIHTFSYCENLTDVYFTGDAPTFADAFCNVTATIYYPADNDTWTADVMQNYGGNLTWQSYDPSGEIASGTCGENLVWSLTLDGVLTIQPKETGLAALFASNDMYDYVGDYHEWCAYHDRVRSIVVADGVSYIGTYAFAHLESVTDVTILGETEVGQYAFYDCPALTTASMDRITALNPYAFSGCTSLNAVELPASVSFIGEGVWYGCTGLTGMSVAPDNSRYSIAGSLLCDDREDSVLFCLPNAEGSVQIPQGITTVAPYALANCTGITEVVIPGSVNSIADGAFRGCVRLERFTISQDNTSYRTDGTALFTADGRSLLAATTNAVNYTVPGGVEVIRPEAFFLMEQLTSVTLPEGVTVLGNNAFGFCSGLETVRLPSTLDTIGHGAFRECGSLKSIDLPEGLTGIGTNAFLGCFGMTGTLRIPGTVTDWGIFAFTGVPVTEVIVGYGLTDLGDGTFSGCRGITAAHIPNTVTGFGEQYDTFSNCDNLVIYAHEGTPAQTYANEKGFDFVAVECRMESTVIAPTCTEEGYTVHTCVYCGNGYTDNHTQPTGHTFRRDTCVNCGDKQDKIASGWSGDTRWMLTDDGVLTVYNPGVMKNYTGSGQVPWYPYLDQITRVVIEDGVTRIGNCAFYGMDIKSIEIADSVTTIGSYAFKNCTLLDNVVLPAKLSQLGESAFYGCSRLSSIDIPAELWTIQPYTFKGCTRLTDLTFHEGNLMKISDSAFYGTGLKSLTLPDCLDIVDTYAFKNCLDLTSITMGSGLTELREAVFYGAPITSIVIPEGITRIGPYAFKNCTELITIDLPESLNTIGEAAFYSDTSLQSVEIPDGVTTIGNYAFRMCSRLTSLSLGSGLETIGECAFYGCSALKELVIPDRVTTIQPYAFKTCTSLSSVTLGSSVATIGEGAFHTCTGLKTLVFPASLTSIGSYCFSGSENLWKLTFQGDAPSIGTNAFRTMEAFAYYPGDNATWTAEVMQNYGGKITWKAQ